MYKLVDNIHLEALNSRYANMSKLNAWGTNVSPICHLGRFHTTHSFSIHNDGDVSISFENEDNNDSFTVDIKMVRVSFNVDFMKQSSIYYYFSNENGNVNLSKVQAFAISIGDIFKHYYKNNMHTISTISMGKKKKNGRNTRKNENEEDENETEDETNEDAYINELILKSLKVNINNNDTRVTLGLIENWKHHDMKLWDLLLDQGHLKNLGSDFTSFCNTYIILPIFNFDTLHPSLSEYLPSLSSYKLVKKLIRFFLSGEDPSSKGWVVPKREYFCESKNIVDILEEYSKDLIERYNNYEYIKMELVRELNNKNKMALDNYPPQIFSTMDAVGNTYPLFALRTIHLLSWCATDFTTLQSFVTTSSSIAKSDRTKHIIHKRGKNQKYSSYDHREFGWPDLRPRNNKFDVVHRELSL